MLTDNEMLEIAKRYMSFTSNDIVEMIVIDQLTIKKPYGNVYHSENRKYFETGDFKYLVVRGPFLVEKATGRVVNFGTAHPLEFCIDEYEKGSMIPSLDLYWYPDTETYDYK